MRCLRNTFVGIGILLCGCAYPSDFHNLVASSGTLYTKKVRDIDECLEEAIKAIRAGRLPLDSAGKRPLKGRATGPFIKNGRPVVDRDGNPASWKSLFTSLSSSELSDLYVLCLLGRGYHWDDDIQTSQ